MPQPEGAYKTRLVKRLRREFPGSLVLRLDPQDQQGIPDILILFNDRWGSLEGKMSATSKVQPNQPYFVDLMNRMSFSAFIHPGNEEEVIRELAYALRA